MKRASITIIGLNFFPESTAIGLYSTQLAQFLEDKGYDITVLTAFPYYPQWKIDEAYRKNGSYLEEQLGSIKLLRYKQYTPSKPTFLKRVWHIIDFTFGTYFNLKKVKDCDHVISVIPFTSSAYLGNILSRRKKANHWIHIQDFEFDAAFQSGLVEGNKNKPGLLYRLLMRLERRVLQKADRVSTISNTMLEKLESKINNKAFLLPNWVDKDDIDPKQSKTHHYLSSSKFKILYSGNIGNKQDWEFFFELVKAIDFNVFEIILVGDGAKRKDIEIAIKNYPGINLYPPVPYDELSDLLCWADVHILFQKSGVVDTMMPSKILGMMASAKPSVASGHENSEVNRYIQESKGGIYVSDRNVETVITFLNTIHTDDLFASEMGKQAREYITSRFDKNRILNEFELALSQL